MDRRTFIALVTGTWVLEPPSLGAQQIGTISKIGVLVAATQPTPTIVGNIAAMRAALRDLGWVEGNNLVVETRWAGENPQRQREIAADLKALPVALIVAPGTITIRAARDGAPDLPVIMIAAGDAVGAGFVASLARPGGNLTGTTAAGEEVLAKQLELLSLVVPALKRVSVLMNIANPANGFFFDAMSSRAKNLGLRLDRIEVSTEGELDQAMMRAKGGALLVVGDPMFGRNHARIADLALRSGLPAIFGGRFYVAAGGLMSYLSSDTWHWRTAATLIDKVLKGAKPADIPVQQPTQYELIINLKTAKALGLSIPAALLLRADEVIQ
ncbi:MAG TPA: ABC transporter substrate-binding protein [Casimicrobiaceae bacterium]|jgi:putative ABC transport system substrate-binding protein|nr:ABC transporter substrate-binding protein [Casimicrobiaceae bacterium]